MANLFDKFKLQTKTVNIEALDGAEVTIQELTVSQSSDFYQRMVSGVGEDGKVQIDYSAIPDIKLDKVATAMIEPKMTVDELKELSSSASLAIDEIAGAIDAFSEELGKE